MTQDLYKILGVNRKASDVEIKKAYRKLARKYHPDLNPGDKNAEKRFKEIQEAHAVLSNSKKKRQYDQFGSVGNSTPGGAQQQYSYGGFEGFNFSNSGSASFQDIFKNMFSGSFQSQHQGPEKGEDLYYTMKVGFMDAINGIQTRIKLSRKVVCSVCRGKGYIQSGGKRVCPVCGGSGQVNVQAGAMRFSKTCRACKGSGIGSGEECSLCHGMGLMQKTERIKVRIPGGVNTGSKVRIASKGNDGRKGGPTGDLFITIEVDSHNFFRREGANIYIKLPITVPEATLGAKIEVPTVYGVSTIKIPPGTKSEQKFRLREKGAPKVGKNKKGDQYVEVTIVPPSFNNERIREIMREIERISGENPRKKIRIQGNG